MEFVYFSLTSGSFRESVRIRGFCYWFEAGCVFVTNDVLTCRESCSAYF